MGCCVSSEMSPGWKDPIVELIQPEWESGIKELIEFDLYMINNPNLWNKYMIHKVNVHCEKNRDNFKFAK